MSGCPTSEGHLVKVVTSGYLSCQDFSLVEVGYKKQMYISLCNQYDVFFFATVTQHHP